MSDYADVLAERWSPVEAASPLRFPPAVVGQHLPAVREAAPLPVVQQAAPLAPAERPYDPWPTRLGFGSVFVLSSGTAVYIACAGLHEAGAELPWLAGSFVGLAALIGMIKARLGGGVRISNFHQGDNSNFQAGQQR